MFHETLDYERMGNGTVEIFNVNTGKIVHIIPAFLSGEFSFWGWFDNSHRCVSECTR